MEIYKKSNYNIYHKSPYKRRCIMEYMEVDVSIESLKIQHAQLDAAIKEEESCVWKNMIRIEQLKKEKLRKKDELLRKSLQVN
ncbi:MAG: DUF465 domain-containing protein [Alphaproteobacteria bacterium]|nr:DUF465 domain-containing protein [Alphaproteobacteria bacterium]